MAKAGISGSLLPLGDYLSQIYATDLKGVSLLGENYILAIHIYFIPTRVNTCQKSKERIFHLLHFDFIVKAGFTAKRAGNRPFMAAVFRSFCRDCAKFFYSITFRCPHIC